MFKLILAAMAAMCIVCFSSMTAKAVNYPADAQIDFLQRQGLTVAQSYDYRASSILIVETYYPQLEANRIANGQSASSGSFVKDIRRIVKGISGTHLTNDAHQRYELIKQVRPYAPSTMFANMAQMAFNFEQGLPTATGFIQDVTSGNFESLIDFGF